jgi:hypothetical protein
MDYPVIFPLRVSLWHKSPEEVRGLAKANGFSQHPSQPDPFRSPAFRGFSEIWFKLAGRGYAIVRIDSQGHSNLCTRDGEKYAIGGISPGVHGAVPHYHKEWITADKFQDYCVQYVPQVVRYNDAGDPVTGAMNDFKAKQTHIKQ